MGTWKFLIVLALIVVLFLTLRPVRIVHASEDAIYGPSPLVYSDRSNNVDRMERAARRIEDAAERMENSADEMKLKSIPQKRGIDNPTYPF